MVSHILERMDYLGHTVNFKTHVKSYKNRKKIDNSPEQWRIFENTHEAVSYTHLDVYKRQAL